MKEQQKKVGTITINIRNDEILRFDKKFWSLIIAVVILILTLIFFKYGKLFSGEKESKPVTADSSRTAANPLDIDEPSTVEDNSENEDHESSEEPTASSVVSGTAAMPSDIDKSVDFDVDGNSKKKISELNLEFALKSVIVLKNEPVDIHQYLKEKGKEKSLDEFKNIGVPQLFSSALDPAKTTLAELLSDENIEFFNKIIQFILNNLTMGKENDYFSYKDVLRIHYQRSSLYTIYVKTTSDKYILIDRYLLFREKPGSAKNTPELGEISFLQDKKYFAEIYFAKLSNGGKTTASKALWTVPEAPKSHLTKITSEGIKNLLLAIQYLNNQGKSHRFINFSEIMVFKGHSEKEEILKLMTYGQVVPIKGYYMHCINTVKTRVTPEYFGKSDEKNIDIYQLGYYLYYFICKTQLRDEDYLSNEVLGRVKTFFETDELEFPEGISEDLKDFIKSCLGNNSGKTEGTSELLKHKFIAGSETQ